LVDTKSEAVKNMCMSTPRWDTEVKSKTTGCLAAGETARHTRYQEARQQDEPQAVEVGMDG
jgi:hypothetical protein